jgi:hypothetical protein
VSASDTRIVAYLRTSCSKDSEKRQRAAVERFAKIVDLVL